MINPHKVEAVADYWRREGLPYVGLADPKHAVAKLYGQGYSLLKFGRLPAFAIVDKAGRVRYRHYGDDMADIPDNRQVLALLDFLAGQSREYPV